MGIYIKGMEMPTRCHCCSMCVQVSDGEIDWHWECCLLCEKVARYATDRIPSCPLVPVPPHGRLIDADALKLSHCKECTLYPDKCLEKTEEGCDWNSIYHIEHCAPTIIEAEEGET